MTGQAAITAVKQEMTVARMRLTFTERRGVTGSAVAHLKAAASPYA